MKCRFIAALAIALVLAGVSTTASATGASGAKRPEGSITVFAASSLTDAYTRIGKDFERGNRDTTITFSFNASSTLATQIQQGAPADVFASADNANMQNVADEVVGTPKTFARNRLAIAVEPGNPLRIKTLADTVADNVILVLCAPEAPCGKFALDAYRKAGVPVPNSVPTGENVKAALSKVFLGEADAAVVYVTDVQAAKGDVKGVAIPDNQNVIAAYPIAALKSSENVELAKEFVKYVRSAAGRKTLQRFGFLPP